MSATPPFQQISPFPQTRQVQLKLCERCRAQNDPGDVLCRRCQSRLPFAIYAYPPGVKLRGKYEITKILGHGAMGIVYQGRHLLLKRKVALKFIHPHLLNDPEQLHRFRREAVTSSAVDHPNAIHVLDLEETEDGVPFLISEFLEGRDLGQAFEAKEEFPLPRIVSLLTQVLNALSEAHEKGVIHRDLKPQNLFLTKTPDGGEKVKIVDFGLAKFFEKGKEGNLLTAEGLVVGTPLYMSPEQVQGEELDGRSDLWSVGVILYTLLTGDSPFAGSSPLHMAMAVLQDNPALPSQKTPTRKIPKAFDELCQRALAKDPLARFSSAAAFREALCAAASLGASPPEVKAAPPLPQTLSHLMIPLSAFGVLLLGVGAVWSLLPSEASLDAQAITPLSGGASAPLASLPTPGGATASSQPSSGLSAPKSVPDLPPIEKKEKLNQKEPPLNKAVPSDRAVPERRPGDNTFTYAKRLFYAGYYPEAARALEEVVKKEPSHAIAHRRLGDTYLKLGRKKEAVVHWKEFLRLMPSSRDAQKVRSDIKRYGG